MRRIRSLLSTAPLTAADIVRSQASATNGMHVTLEQAKETPQSQAKQQSLRDPCSASMMGLPARVVTTKIVYTTAIDFLRLHKNTSSSNTNPSNGFPFKSIPVGSSTRSCHRHLTSTREPIRNSPKQVDRLESSLAHLEAETDELLRKIKQGVSTDFRKIDERSKKETAKDIVSSEDTFRLVETWSKLASSKASGRKHAALRCQQIVQALEDHCKDTTLEPNRHFYDLLLQALCATEQVQVAHGTLLKLCKDAAQQSRKPHSRVNKVSVKSFHIVMNGWTTGNIRFKKRQNSGTRQQKKVILEKVQELYQTLEALYDATGQRDNELGPNERTLTSLLVAQSGHPDAGNKIIKLLLRALEQRQPVDLTLFHTVLQALTTEMAMSNSREAARQTAELCEQLLELAISQFHLHPTCRTYSLIIHAWAQCEAVERQGEAAQRAEKLLQLMMQSYSTDGANVKPNTLTFTTCMAAWSRCDRPERAQRLLDELLKVYQQTKDPDLKPDTACGNTVVLAWSRSDNPLALEKTKEALEKLHNFASADLISYNGLLHAYSRRGMYAEARALIGRLEMDGTEHGNQRLLPDAVSYNCALHALLRTKVEGFEGDKKPGIAMEAQALVGEMKSLAKQNDRAEVHPTTATYTLLLQAYATQGNSMSSNCGMPPEQGSLDNIRQVLQDVVGTSVPSPQHMIIKQKAGTGVDVTFCVALLKACSAWLQMNTVQKDTSKLAFDIMIGVLKARSRGHRRKHLDSLARPMASTFITDFPYFRIHDDWLYLIMLETCDKALVAGVGNLREQVAVDGVSAANPAATAVTSYHDRVALEEWMALVDAIVNCVTEEGYFSRRIIKQLKTLSKTLAQSNYDPRGRQRMVGQRLLSDTREANREYMQFLPSTSTFDIGEMKQLPAEWSRRIPSRHRP